MQTSKIRLREMANFSIFSEFKPDDKAVSKYASNE